MLAIYALGLALAAPPDLAPGATVTASSESGAKYAPARVIDGNDASHWASADNAPLPQTITLTWPTPQRFDTVLLDPFAREDPNLYAAWQTVTIEAAGQRVEQSLPPRTPAAVLLRFPSALESVTLTIAITAVHESRHYVGIDTVSVYFDPDLTVRLPTPLDSPMATADLQPTGRPTHPIVYLTAADVARARENAKSPWGKPVAERIIAAAEAWLAWTDADLRKLLPPPGACYAYGFSGSPKNGEKWGTWGGARCDWKLPGKVATADGQVFPNAEFPDDGAGYHGADGRMHYFVGSWNAWVTEQWQQAIDQLADAYALTGHEQYAERAAYLLDLLASIYPESSSGSWDYPSSPPSGRFARPWYQVARVLVHYVEAYDLIYASGVLDRPSARPALEAEFPPLPWPQTAAVGTPARHGFTRPGLTRRENIDRNLILDGATYCYEHTFGGMLHNGHADYLRGALAGGCLLGVKPFVHHAVEGPYSLGAMVANNCDRDGRYYETSLMYALHARELYLTFVLPLKNWRDDDYPNGVNPVDDAQFRSFYRLPALSLDCAGHAPNFGDTGPDHTQAFPTRRPFHAEDYLMAEQIHASARGPAKDEFAAILRWLAKGDIERLRAAHPSRWLLYHAEPLPAGPEALPAEAERQVSGSWLLGQKGLALLRDGAGQDAQAALLRFGPSLNHGHLDDLGLIYYANGWQNTYEIGYGLGSTHTQVGWARQTASHSLVTVNETPQKGPGSGGSLHLFSRFAGCQIVEASSPTSYAAEGVTEYRRTVALLGAGRDQILVDLFRVVGGRQHDYHVGSQGQDWTVDGLTLGQPETGSLAPGVAYGQVLGNDGDVRGVPGKPYWNPPPGNGFGFFFNVRRAAAPNPWTMTWRLGGANDAHFQVRLLPEPGTTAVVAHAPGLYPSNRPASYAMLRRAGEDGLRSAFASVMAPYAQDTAGRMDVTDLADAVVESQGEWRVGAGYGNYLFFRGAAAGDHVTIALDAPRESDYRLTLVALGYPSYAAIQVSLDGRALPGTFDLKSSEATPQRTFDLGLHRLRAGTHQLRFELAPPLTAGIFGLQGLQLRSADAPADAPPASPVTAAVRLPVEGSAEGQPIALALTRAGEDAVLLSATGEPAPRTVRTAHGPVTWTGGVAYLVFDAEGPANVHLAGCDELRVGDLTFTPATGAYRATVTAVDARTNTVTVDQPLPETGLEGEAAIFSRPEWSRTSAYRIGSVRAVEGGSEIRFGDQTFHLGRGRVHQIVDAHKLLSDVPHEYTRSVVGGTVTRFFDGKRAVGERGGETRIRSIQYGQPMPLDVEDTAVFQEGETIDYLDLGPGDRLTVPTSVVVRRSAEG